MVSTASKQGPHPVGHGSSGAHCPRTDQTSPWGHVLQLSVLVKVQVVMRKEGQGRGNTPNLHAPQSSGRAGNGHCMHLPAHADSLEEVQFDSSHGR